MKTNVSHGRKMSTHSAVGVRAGPGQPLRFTCTTYECKDAYQTSGAHVSFHHPHYCENRNRGVGGATHRALDKQRRSITLRRYCLA